MINVGCDAATTQRRSTSPPRYEGVYASAGLAPARGQARCRHDRHFLDDPNVIAVGECGLDYFYEHSPRDVATRGVRRTDRTSRTNASCRWSCTPATRGTTRSTCSPPRACPSSTIFHCFTGGPDEARRCLDLGAFLSFSGIVTFKTATDLQAAAGCAPPTACWPRPTARTSRRSRTAAAPIGRSTSRDVVARARRPARRDHRDAFARPRSTTPALRSRRCVRSVFLPDPRLNGGVTVQPTTRP